MKNINKVGILFLCLSIAFLAWSCEEADDEFVHTKNVIKNISCKAIQGGSEFVGEIHEYDKDGNLMEGPFTQEDVEGGYGLVLFPVSQSLSDEVDLTSVYLTAGLEYDQIVTPSLSGKHDISGEGMVIGVKSGVGTVRYYRLRGYYE